MSSFLFRDRERLGFDVRASIPFAAADALAAGLDTPSLRVVAGLDSSVPVEDWDRWWGTARHEVGLVELSPADAVLPVCRRIAAALREGRSPAPDAAQEISDITLRVPEHPPEVLHPFIYIASEWDERATEDQTEMLRALFAAAVALEADEG